MSVKRYWKRSTEKDADIICGGEKERERLGGVKIQRNNDDDDDNDDSVNKGEHLLVYDSCQTAFRTQVFSEIFERVNIFFLDSLRHCCCFYASVVYLVFICVYVICEQQTCSLFPPHWSLQTKIKNTRTALLRAAFQIESNLDTFFTEHLIRLFRYHSTAAFSLGAQQIQFFNFERISGTFLF